VDRHHRVGADANPTQAISGLSDSFFEGLRERGWIDGENVTFEFREGRDSQALATELVNLKADVIVTLSTPPTLAAKAATRTIPIVFPANDTVEQGLVASLARPGGNLTRLEWGETQLVQKRLQLLTEVIPRIRRVAILVDPDLQQHDAMWQRFRRADGRSA
jgi:ABC-type uncharacterized transport system substrate-binding protein